MKTLIARYTELAAKVEKTADEEIEMKNIIGELMVLAPKYAQALSDAQGDVTESIKIANAALEEQLLMLKQIDASEAQKSLMDDKTQKNWQEAFTSNLKFLEGYNYYFVGNDHFAPALAVENISSQEDLESALYNFFSGFDSGTTSQIRYEDAINKLDSLAQGIGVSL